MSPFVDPPSQTIDGQWEFLLMEAARVRDENREKEPEPEEPVAPPAAVEPPPPPMPRPAPPVRIPTVEPIAGAQPIPTIANIEKPRGSRLDEMVVCSPKGEVLYEWQSNNSSDRVSFLEFLSQKSAQLGEGLNLGAFDRLEMEGERHRVVAQVKNDRGLFIRATKTPAKAARS